MNYKIRQNTGYIIRQGLVRKEPTKKCYHSITIKHPEFGTVKCLKCGYVWDNERQLPHKSALYRWREIKKLWSQENK